MGYPRVKKRQISEYRALLRLDWDWSCNGIWIIQEPRQKHCGSHLSSYKSLNLPIWLIERFEYWTDWLESSAHWNGHERPDKPLIAAYELSLAIDLKRILGDDYYIECQGREIHDDRAYLRKENSKK